MEEDQICETWRATRAGAFVLCGPTVVAHLPQGHRRKADSRLIAAAPELLTACEALVQWFDDCFIKDGELPADELLRAYLAIDKAKGDID